MSQAYVVAEERTPGFVAIRVCVTSGTEFRPESDQDCWHTVATRSRAVATMNIARHIADTLNDVEQKLNRKEKP